MVVKPASISASSDGVPSAILIKNVSKKGRLERGKITMRLEPTGKIAIRAGDLVAIVGLTGAGKSTLAHLIAGALRPDGGGEVAIGGRRIRGWIDGGAHLAFLPQTDTLLPTLTPRQYLDAEARLRPVRPGEAQVRPAERVAKVLSQVRLPDKAADRPIKDLSGGEKKRTSLAAELLSSPRAWLLDEPLAGLDPRTGSDVLGLLRAEAAKGAPVLVVTHHTVWLDRFDLVIVLAERRVVYVGPPDALKRRVEDASLSATTEWEWWVSLYDWADARTKGWTKPIIDEPREQWKEIEKCQLPPSPPGFWPQLDVLVDRTWRTYRPQLRTLADPFAAAGALAFAVPYVAAGALAFALTQLFPGTVLDLRTGDEGQARRLIFIIALMSVLAGFAGGVPALAREIDVYARGRRTGLNLGAYLAAKVAVVGGLAVLQAMIVTGALAFAGVAQQPLLQLLPIIALSALAGLGLGLAVSALTRDELKGSHLVPWVVGAQVILAGVLAPLDETMTRIASFMPVRWSYLAIGKHLDVDKVPTAKGYPELPPTFTDGLGEYVVILGVTFLLGLIITVIAYLIREIEI